LTTAVETGLRASELRSLTWASFELDGHPPTVTVKAAYSKHRRDDVPPLKPSLAQSLARWGDESGEVDRVWTHPVFASMPDKPAKMLGADLQDAGIPWGGGPVAQGFFTVPPALRVLGVET
jgi:integrase